MSKISKENPVKLWASHSVHGLTCNLVVGERLCLVLILKSFQAFQVEEHLFI